MHRESPHTLESIVAWHLNNTNNNMHDTIIMCPRTWSLVNVSDAVYSCIYIYIYVYIYIYNIQCWSASVSSSSPRSAPACARDSHFDHRSSCCQARPGPCSLRPLLPRRLQQASLSRWLFLIIGIIIGFFLAKSCRRNEISVSLIDGS